MRRSAARTALLIGAALAVVFILSRSRIRTVESLSDQGYFDKYPYMARVFRDGRLSPERIADVSPLYLRLIAGAEGRLGVDEVRELQVGATTAAAVLCGAAAGWLAGPAAAIAALLIVLGNRAALVNATELEPETLILLLNAIAVLLMCGWLKTRRTSFLAGSALALGLSAITRPTAILPIILLTVWILETRRPDARTPRRPEGHHPGVWASGRPGVRSVSAFLLVALLPIVALLASNFFADRPAVVMDPGTVFYEGMNPLATGYGGVQPKIVNDLERLTSERDALHLTYRLVASRAVGRPLTKAESNRYWTGKALAFARSYPARALRLLTEKAWFAVKSYEAYDLITMVRKDRELQKHIWIPFGLGLALAVAGAVLRTEHSTPLVLLSLGFAAPLVMFYVTARQRNALLPPLAVLAGLGVAALLEARRTGLRHRLVMTVLSVTLVAVISIVEGHRQREDRHGWVSALSAQELRARAGSLSDAEKAKLVRAHAGTWLTADSVTLDCESVVPAAVEELKRAAPQARLFDLAVIFGKCRQWDLSLKILDRLQQGGYQPVRDTRSPSSIAYHQARAWLGTGHPARGAAAAQRALGEAPGDADVLALRAAMLPRSERQSLLDLAGSLHDPFTGDLALAQALLDTGQHNESRKVQQRLIRSMPEWKRARELAEVR